MGPLDNYLRENPHLKRIVLCLDADGPGQEAAEKFRAEYTQKGYAVSIKTPARQGLERVPAVAGRERRGGGKTAKDDP